MKVLITGADGVLGNNLVREVLLRQHKVTVLLVSKELPALGLEGLPIARLYGNILDHAAVDAAVCGQDYVIHAAASTQVYPARSAGIRNVNVGGTLNIIEACLRHNIKRLIHVGTANSFAPGTIQKPGNEDGPFTGFSIGLDYIDSKYEAQQRVLDAVQHRNLKALVVNPAFMIGPYDTKPSSGALLLALFHGRILGYTSGSKSYIPVKDAAVAIANALTMGEIGQCYILSNFSLKHREALSMMAKTIGVRPPSFPLPSWLVRLSGIMASWKSKSSGNIPSLTKEMAIICCGHHCYSGEKARKELLMPCSNFDAAVAECFEWFRQHYYIQK